MKKLLFFGLCCIGLSASAQTFNADASRQAQKDLDREFADPKESPLTESDLKKFHGLDFFPVSEKFFVVARFTPIENATPFAMKTTTTRLPMYVKYGTAEFIIDGKPQKLTIYRNIELSKKEGFEDYLFLPFRDETNGDESYAGGRYIDLKIPEGDTIVLDFNKAYNPYCAYNHQYSCPIVPSENVMEIAIQAGVKKFHD